MTLQTLNNYAGMLLMLDRLDGIAASTTDENKLMRIRLERTKLCRRIDEVECWINEIPDEWTRVIFLLRFADRQKWKDIAASLGGGNTEDSVKKRCLRYLKAYG